MTGDDKKLEKKLGLDIPFSEAIQRFANVTREELEEAARKDFDVTFVPEGVIEVVPFKGVTVRKTLNKSEWWFSIVDVCEALTGSRTALTTEAGPSRRQLRNGGRAGRRPRTAGTRGQWGRAACGRRIAGELAADGA